MIKNKNGENMDFDDARICNQNARNHNNIEKKSLGLKNHKLSFDEKIREHSPNFDKEPKKSSEGKK